MKVEIADKRRERLRITPETEEDLWVLRTILRPGDLVGGRTLRDVAVGGRGEKEKRPIWVKIRVKNVEFQPFTGKLRVFGVIVEGPEEYGVKGKHQSILATPGSTLLLERPGGWSEKVIEKLRSSGPRGSAVIAAIDYDEYGVAVLSQQGLKIIVDKYTRLPGKDDPSRDQELARIVQEVSQLIVEAASKYGSKVAVIVGPGPLKHEVAAKVRSQAPFLHVIVDDASMGGRAGIEEALRRQSVARALRDYSIAEAEEILGEVMRRAAKNPNTIAIGPKEVAAAAVLGAVEKIVVVDNMIFHIDDYIRELTTRAIDEAEKRGARIIMVPIDTPVGERLQSLGGIVALLRYPLPKEALEAALVDGGAD